jgi:serine/threonine protein kinase/tetratricopeptide (TPR) repeat protein
MESPALTVRSLFEQAIEIESPAERKTFLDRACASDPELRSRVEALLQADVDAGSSFLRTPDLPLESTGPYHPGDAGADEPPAAEPETAVTVPPATPSAPAEGPGARIGPYRLVELLGEGGMGAVYRAEQERPIRRQVALKIIKPSRDGAPIVARFEIERQALTLMDHANIAHVLDAGTTEQGRPYFVMELVPGVPITRYCNDNRMTVRQRLELFVPVCEALQHAHQKGIIHRDVKPTNVLVCVKDGKPLPKVIDFGVAKAAEPSLTDQSQLTETGAIVGTLKYMSPEQAGASERGVDTRTDVYALGVMLYELLTGTTPLDGARAGSLVDMVMRIKEEETPRPSARVAGLGERLAAVAAQRATEPTRLAELLRVELDWIALKALDKDRERRYPSAGDFARDVRHYLDDEPVAACPPTRRYRLGKFVRRHRALLAVTALIFLSLVVAVGSLIRGNIVANGALRQEAKQRRTAIAATDVSVEALGITFAERRANRESAPRVSEEDKAKLRALLQNYRQALGEPAASADARAAAAKTEFVVGSVCSQYDLADDAETSFRTAIELYEALPDDVRDVTDNRIRLARCYLYLADLLRAQGRREEAEGAYTQAIRWFRTSSGADPDDAQFRLELSDACNDLGVVLRRGKRFAKAEESLRQALRLREVLLRQTPGVVLRVIDLAGSYHNLGNTLRDAGDPQAALASYKEAVKLLNRLEPGTNESKLTLRNVCWDRAEAEGRLHKDAAAVADWKAAIQLDTGQAKPHLQAFLATAEAEVSLKAAAKPDGRALVQAAAVYAVAVPAAAEEGESDQGDRYVRRALDLLSEASKAGWFQDPAHVKALKEDATFDPLRANEEFKRFLANLQDTKATKPGPAKD